MNIKTLAASIKSLEEQISKCAKCGICQSVCPVFKETRIEMDVARGKLAILSALSKDMFKSGDNIRKYLHKCLLCGRCQASCPSRVDTIEIFIKARSILAEFSRISKTKKSILKFFLSNPKKLDFIVTILEKLQNFYPNFKILAKKAFHKEVPFLNTESGNIKAAFFTGCLIDKIFPNIAKDCLDVLAYHNIGIYLPENQGCCGMPSLAYGDLKTARKLIAYHITLLEKEDFDYLITACPTCLYVIKNLWHIFAENEELKKKALILSKKSMDINRFIVLHTDFKRFSEKNVDKNDIIVTYHDPCHLKKSFNIFKEPRELLNLPGYCFKEMENADACCGMGGTFNITHHDISKKIGMSKKKNVENTGCAIVSSACPACMIQISNMLSSSEKKISVKHPIEIYAEYLRKI